MLDDSCLYPFQIYGIINAPHEVDVVDFDPQRAIMHLRGTHDAMYHIDMTFPIHFWMRTQSPLSIFFKSAYKNQADTSPATDIGPPRLPFVLY